VGPAGRIAVVGLCFFAAATALPAQENVAPPTPAQLAAMERLRPLVEAIWLELRTPAPRAEPRPRRFWEVTDRLLAMGPDVVPFLTTELELMDPATMNLCAYALGRLGGHDAEVALRKAVRAADALGGQYGMAAKQYALFGLALIGTPDALDLMQTGVSVYRAEIIHDLPLVTHLALLIGPAAAPTLEKQIEAYQSDPATKEKLLDALLALGRDGTASQLPKIEPLLENSHPEIRAVTADAMSRLGEPPLCEKVLVPLSSAVQGERRYVAKTFERWKPEPCYAAMVGRLEVERDIGVRGPLYNAIAAMGGEAALDVFRTYAHWGDQFDQALVVIAIGQIGSPKGLNVLRSLLSDPNTTTVIRALQAMGAIGGEGATDTLMAAASDPRRSVASAARETLVAMGVKKVASRVASAMLATVGEPVGDPNLHVPVAKWGDALVQLKYTDPIDDLTAAAAVQSDLEIKNSLESCVRRLQLIKKNGDNVSAWATASVSAFPDVRKLADRRLAEIGSKSAVKAIKARLLKADLPAEEREGILLAIGEARTDGAAELVESHLSEPAYDGWELQGVRSAAAWAARRLGGDRMVNALRSSAVRRDGQDFATLVYLAVLEKSVALPTLTTLRVTRLRYPEAPFGPQEKQLDAIISDLVGGRDPKTFDVRPHELFEH
jgi:HEAT repeat protein